MPTWAWVALLFFVMAIFFIVLLYQRDTHRVHSRAMVELAVANTRRELLHRVRRHGIRYEVHLVEWPSGGWRWTIWDADGLLHPKDEAGVALPYAAGNAPTRMDAEAQALAEIAGLRLQERVDEVFVA